jgi:hypothetical protein
MIVKLLPGGILDLEQLYTKATLKKIFSYSTEKEGNSIVVSFYDVRGNILCTKLRKRGKAKKA